MPNNNVIFGPLNWISKHIVTFIILIILTISTIGVIYLHKYGRYYIQLYSILLPFVSLYGSNLNVFGAVFIMILLFSGIEVSIGSFKYAFWIFMISLIILIYRFLASQFNFGIYYLIYAEFITFLNNHKPAYYFKIRDIRFTDTLLYSIASVQFIAITHQFDELLIVLFFNAFYKLIMKLFGITTILHQAPIHTTDIGADIAD